MKILFTGLDSTRFGTLGELIHRPALELVRDEAGYKVLPDIMEKLGPGVFDWIVFLGPAGVEPFLSAAEDFRLEKTAIAGMLVAAAGAGTAELLCRHGLKVDAVQSEPGNRGILKMIGDAKENRLLLVKGSHFPRELEKAVSKRGWNATSLSLRRLVPNPQLGSPLPEHDAIYFVSPSGVRNYWQTYGEDAFQKEVWCMGDMTLAEVMKLGMKGKLADPGNE